MADADISSQTKATATRAEKKIVRKIDEYRSFTGRHPLSLHIYPKDYDALRETGRLRGFGVKLLRATE